MRRSYLAAILLVTAPASAQSGPVVSELHTLVPGETGEVVLGYDVNPDGRAQNCAVEQSSGFPRLDAASCEMMIRYGRFPSGGTPARASRAIRWVTPTAKSAVSRASAPKSTMSAGSASDWASLNPDWGRDGKD